LTAGNGNLVLVLTSEHSYGDEWYESSHGRHRGGAAGVCGSNNCCSPGPGVPIRIPGKFRSEMIFVAPELLPLLAQRQSPAQDWQRLRSINYEFTEDSIERRN